MSTKRHIKTWGLILFLFLPFVLHSKAPQIESTEGYNTYITNKSGQDLIVQWETLFYPEGISLMKSQKIQADTEMVKANSGITWYAAKSTKGFSRNQPNKVIVEIFQEGTKKLLGITTVTENLFAANRISHDKRMYLDITIDSNLQILVNLKRKD